MKKSSELTEIELKKLQMKRKYRRNKIKRRLIVFLFLFVCTGVIFTVLKAPVFNIKSVVCVGQENLTEDEIIKVAEVKMGTNIFSANISAMKRKIAAIPEVSESNVRRLFPNKIKIWVRECKKVARVKTGSTNIIIDVNGKILGYTDGMEASEIEKLTDTIGINIISEEEGECVSGDDLKAKKIYECMNVLNELGMLEKTNKIDATDLSDIRIEYEKRLEIFLGSYENMEYKLKFVQKVINENISEYEKARLDYRGESLYVGPREEPQQVVEGKEEEVEDSESIDNVENNNKSEVTTEEEIN